MCSTTGLPTPGSEVFVLITRVQLNPSCGLVELWVNMDDSRKSVYEQMREEIQIPKRKFDGSEGKPGDLCLVCISDSWHRARIVSAHSEAHDVFLIDQGQPHSTTSEALAWAQSYSLFLPPEVESCVLANVLSLEDKWPERAAKFLKSLPGKKFKGLVQHVLMPDRTVLLDIPVVSKHMSKLRVAKKIPAEEFKNLVLKYLHPPEEESSEVVHTSQEHRVNVRCQFAKPDRYFYPELSTETFETVNVTEVQDPLNVFCRLLIFSKAVKILSEHIHQLYEGSSDFEESRPRTRGDPCAARGTDGRWRRSVLRQNIATDDGAVEVTHVDEGRTELVPVRDVRPILGDFLRIPVITYCCSLNGVKQSGREWTAEEKEYLKSLLLNQTVVARLDHHSQDVYYVTLYAANAVCINKCFLQMAGLIPAFKPGRDVQMKPVPLSFLRSVGDKQGIDLLNKTKADRKPKESSLSPKKQVVNDRMDDVSTACVNDIHTKANSKHPDPEVQKTSDNVFSVGSSVNVKVSCVESPLKFWCQTAESGDSLRRLMKNLQTYYTSVQSRPLVESVCVARNPDDDTWYRARIVAGHHSPLVDVRFIDYGETRKIPLRDVHPIDPAFLRLNAQAFQCCLSNLKNPSDLIGETDATLTGFQRIVDPSNSPLKCVVRAVTSDEEGQPLNIVDIETASGGASRSETRVPSDSYKYSTHTIEVGGKEKVWVTSSESVHHFHCQLHRNSHLFDKVIENVAELLDQPRSSDPRPGPNSLCLARYSDDQWYRGQVVEMSPKPKVHFVDYGDTLTVNEADIRPLPSEASVARSVPVQTVPLGLFDVPAELPQEVNRWFAEHVAGHGFTISVVAKGERGKLIVELFDGSMNVNVKVRERITEIKQHKMMMTEQDEVHSSNGLSAKPTLDVILEDKETSIQSSHCDSNMTKPSVPAHLQRNVHIYEYKWPNISGHRAEEEVYASCISGPQYFWCQSSDTEDLSMVVRLAQEEAQAQRDVVFPQTLEPGSRCLVLFPSDEQWYRAQVIQKADKTLQVLFVDYGNECEVGFENVRPLPQSLLEISPQAFLCSLHGFDETQGSWDDQVYDEFYSFVVNKPLRVTVFNRNKHSEIAVPRYAVKVECGKGVLNSLMQKYWKLFSTEISKNKAGHTESSPRGIQTEGNITHCDVSKGNVSTCMFKEPDIFRNKPQMVYASCISEPFFFWCQSSSSEELCRVSQLAQEAGQEKQDVMFPEPPGAGCPCLALFTDHKWYRAQVLHKGDNTLRVLFIDYGNECEVDVNHVRPLPWTLLEKPPQAFLCRLNGFDESQGSWDDPVYDDFYNLLVDKPLRLTVVNMEVHSETTLPQYAVEIECEGVVVNAAMQKYWKPAECVTTESPDTDPLLQGGHTESNRRDVSKGNVSTCMYKEPDIFRNKPQMVYASCISEPFFFWCQSSSSEELCRVSQLAQEAGQEQQDVMFPEPPGPGGPCLALFSDHKWYRAQVLHKGDNTLRVLFIDYGNECEVDVNHVRPLPWTLLEKPPQAFLCRLNGFDESRGSWDDAVYDDFYNLLVDKPLRLTVVNMELHSETTLPQYAVEVECEGVAVNSLMDKYWKEVYMDNNLGKSLVSVDLEETRTSVYGL